MTTGEFNRQLAESFVGTLAERRIERVGVGKGSLTGEEFDALCVIAAKHDAQLSVIVRLVYAVCAESMAGRKKLPSQ